MCLKSNPTPDPIVMAYRQRKGRTKLDAVCWHWGCVSLCVCVCVCVCVLLTLADTVLTHKLLFWDKANTHLYTIQRFGHLGTLPSCSLLSIYIYIYNLPPLYIHTQLTDWAIWTECLRARLYRVCLLCYAPTPLSKTNFLRMFSQQFSSRVRGTWRRA